MIYQSFITTLSASRPSEILQHRLETPGQERVDNPQIESKEKDGGNDDYRRAEHFILRWPGNFLHFRAHVLIELLAGLIPPFYFICRIHDLNLAGQEGLEPPACGFGDRRSTNWSYWPAIP